MRIFTVDELEAHVGTSLGTSQFVDVTQRLVNAFADVTGDHQWIHVDTERAASVLRGTIAHGLLMLSLGPQLQRQVVQVKGITRAINYGYNRIRFPSALPVGSRLCCEVLVKEVKKESSFSQCTFVLTFRAEGVERPVCVAESIVRYYTD